MGGGVLGDGFVVMPSKGSRVEAVVDVEVWLDRKDGQSYFNGVVMSIWDRAMV